MTELLLLSNSRAPGQAFLEHAAGAVRSVLGGRTQIVFVPFASGDPGAYADLMRKALAGLGIGVPYLGASAGVSRSSQAGTGAM